MRDAVHTVVHSRARVVGALLALGGATAAITGLGLLDIPRTASAAATTDRAGEVEAARAVDRHIEAACEAASLQPNEPADALAVMRRLSLALTGTVPSLEELRATDALAGDERIDAHLDHLLEDRRFADHWAERLARAYVGTESGPFIVYRRRRLLYWLSDALASNMPYDELVTALVASEGLWTDRPETNFITAYDRDPKALGAASARAFLGLRLDCAECHDHPFSHWKQSDFEGLAAFYAGVDQELFGIVDRGGPLTIEEPSGETRQVEAAVPFAPSALPTEGRSRERLATWITHPDNPYFAKAIAHRVWTLMFGQPLTQAVDDIEADPAIPGVLDELASDFSKHDHDLKRLVRVVARTEAFRRRAAGAGDGARLAASKLAAFPVTPLRGEQIAGALAQVSQLRTIDAESHILWRLMRAGTTSDFVERYGDRGRDELTPAEGTIMQRLTMMNGKVAAERTEANLMSAAGRIAGLAPSDEERVRLCFLVTLTREPTEGEMARFVGRLAGKDREPRREAIEDLLWALVNTTEFSWSH